VLREPERENYSFSSTFRARSPAMTKLDHKSSQFLEPLFEYSGACTGRGETHSEAARTVRRPPADRERHRLLVDPLRQPADHPVTTNRDGRGRRGRTRCSKTTPNSFASGWRSTRTAPRGAVRIRRAARRRLPRPSTPINRTKPASPRATKRVVAFGSGWPA
jgi:hypothetical protein